MQRVLPVVVGVMIASVGLVTNASSADMPPSEYVFPQPLQVGYNWTGFYIGGHGGYGAGTINLIPHGTDIDGWFAGGQIGFNWQNGRSPWVFGIEVDSAFGKIERDVDLINGNGFANAFTEIDYLGTARARIGYAADRMLVYGTGGIAWAHNEVSLFADTRRLSAAATTPNTHVGFAVGAGFEWALSRSWTMKLEYLYNDLGSKNYLSGTFPGGINADLRFSTGKLGLNYIFDWGRSYSGPKY